MANKKINQLVLKTTIQSTDLFPLGDATTGQLYKKTIAELQAAIGGAVISVNGLVGTVVLDTDDIQELASPTNKYFTDARARAAISLTTTGNSGASTYSSSTGVLNVPTYTLAGLGGITAGFLSGGTGITYNSTTGVISYSGTVFTDASIRALVSAGTGLSYNSTTGVFSYSGTVYTDSSVRALISGTAPITYNNTTGAIGITQATTSTNGYLSSTDWNTFNGKQSALTLGNFTEATSSVLTITGGTGAVIGSGTSIQVKQASSTVSGFLSSTDWTTFNSKQGTITLTTTGTSGAATFSGGTLNIPQYQGVLTNPVTGTGTSGHVAYFNGSGTIAGDSGHFWDNTNKRLGIGTSSPGNSLDVQTSSGVGSSTATGLARFITAGSTTAISIGQSNSARKLNIDSYSVLVTGEDLVIGSTNAYSATIYTNNAERMRITSAGNVEIKSAGQLIAYRSDNARSGSFFCDNVAVQLTSSNDPLRISSADRLEFYTGGSERMRITSAGNIDFGGFNPIASSPITSYKQAFYGALSIMYRGAEDCYINTNHTYTTGGSNVASYSSGNGLGRMDLVGGYLQWASYNGSVTAGSSYSLTARFICTNAGNFLIGTSTDNGERLYVSGSIRATGSITANSDARLKKNIERIENALEKVGQISGYTYNTIYDEDRHAGVIAQEIDLVLPEIVNKGNDGLMGVEYGNISALLIEAIKDLKQRNEKLEAIVEGLSK